MRKLNTGPAGYGQYYDSNGQPMPHLEMRENGHGPLMVPPPREIDGEPRETISPLMGAGAYSRLSSNRMLSVGLDKRIMKQSTEDCRRLLQQVSQTK